MKVRDLVKFGDNESHVYVILAMQGYLPSRVMLVESPFAQVGDVYPGVDDGVDVFRSWPPARVVGEMPLLEIHCLLPNGVSL